MSVFLTIAGFTLEVVEQGASQGASFIVGKSERSFSGNLRSTISGEKRNWAFTPLDLAAEDEAVLKAAVPYGAFVQCGGDALVIRGSSATILCEVTYKDAAYVIDDFLGYRKTLGIALSEV